MESWNLGIPWNLSLNVVSDWTPDSNSAGEGSLWSSGVALGQRSDVSGTDLVMFHFRRANLTDFTWLSTNPTGIVKGELLEGLVVEIRSVVSYDFGDALFGRTGKC